MNLIVCIYIDNWENRIELYYKAIRLIGEVFMKIAKSLEKSIIKDSELFCSLGLIDYSLIVMKIDVHAI